MPWSRVFGADYVWRSSRRFDEGPCRWRKTRHEKKKKQSTNFPRRLWVWFATVNLLYRLGDLTVPRPRSCGWVQLPSYAHPLSRPVRWLGAKRDPMHTLGGSAALSRRS